MSRQLPRIPKMRHTASLLVPAVVAITLVLSGVRAEAKRGSEERVTKPVIQTEVKVVPNKDAEEGLFDPADGYLKRGPRDEKTLVLTFDDGPHPASATRLLDILKEFDVKATFFVVGERVQMHPDIVRRMLAEGHEVANHTQHHLRLHELPEAKVIQELRECEDSVRKATGHSMSFMRPPGMRFTPKVMAEARAQGYVMVGVNNVSGDYVPNGGVSDLTPEEASALGLGGNVILERVKKQLKPGTIILLHDNPVTVEQVPAIIAYAREQGYRFITTSELMASLPEPVKIVANPLVVKK